MAFNKISLNKVDSQNVSQIVILPDPPVNDVANQFDIFYHLGTQLNQTTFTNPTTAGNVSITLTEGTIEAGSLPALVSRSTGASVQFNPGVVTIQIELLNNFEIDLHSYLIANSTSLNGAATAWLLEASNDSNNWIKIDQVNDHPNASGAEQLYYCESRHGFFKYFRFRNFTWVSDEVFTEVLFFGKLRNLITGQAAIESTKDILASYPSISSNARYRNQILRYDGTYWEPRTRFPYEVVKLVLTDDHIINSAYKPTFYTVSPNGSNRVITLPSSPDKDDVIKIKNLDGAFDLKIEEFDQDPTPVIMNNSGKLQYEFVYDGEEWQVTG